MSSNIIIKDRIFYTCMFPNTINNEGEWLEVKVETAASILKSRENRVTKELNNLLQKKQIRKLDLALIVLSTLAMISGFCAYGIILFNPVGAALAIGVCIIASTCLAFFLMWGMRPMAYYLTNYQLIKADKMIEQECKEDIQACKATLKKLEGRNKDSSIFLKPESKKSTNK